MTTKRILIIALISMTVLNAIAFFAKRSESAGTTGNPSSNWIWSNNWNDSGKQPEPQPVKPEPLVEEQPKPKEEKPEGKKVGSYTDAIAASKATGLPVVAVFSASWCHWCQKLKTETLNDAKVQEALKKYIFVIVDVDQDKAASKKFGVSGIPAYVITNGDEKKVKSGNGFKAPKDFMSWLGG